MSDQLSERTASLRLPAPPGESGRRRAAYPPIPSGPQRNGGRERGSQSTSRLALVAMVAGLVGAMIGSGVMIAYTNGADESAASSSATSAGGEVLTPTVEDGEERGQIASVAAAVVDTVVQVNTEGGSSATGKGGNGSGVIYRSDGYIVTNNHVVAEANGLEVVLADGTELPAEVVGTDESNDLAVVRVEQTGLPAIPIGDSSDLQVGETAIAVGSPFDLEGTVTAGVISAVNRGPISVGVPGRGQQIMSDLIQTDAPINPGNSGGALVGTDARLIGINSAILTRSGASGNAGVGFAIPANTVVKAADSIIEKGYVAHPFLGVEGKNVSSSAAERLGVEEGAHVDRAMEGTPAAAAGLVNDDVVVQLDGEEITSMDDLVMAVRNREIGDTVTLTYVRDGERHTTEAQLAERPRGG